MPMLSLYKLTEPTELILMVQHLVGVNRVALPTRECLHIG